MGLFHKKTDTRLNQYTQAVVLCLKCEATKINNCCKVSEFEDAFQSLMDNFDKLIHVNEKQRVSMTPTPRQNKNQVIRNMEATINDFIERARRDTVLLSQPDKANRLDELASEIEYSRVLERYITKSNRRNIAKLREEANEIRVRINESDQKRKKILEEQETRKKQKFEFEAYLSAVKEQEENWWREMRGFSPVEDELDKIDHMEGHDFERWCADLLEQNGFQNVEVTPGSNDQGVDILAEKDGIKYAIQCKCYSQDLGNTPVQEVNTGKIIYHCHVGVVMTNRYFTKGAKDAAAATGVLLWGRDKLEEMIRAE